MAYLAYSIRNINRAGTITSEQATKEIENYLKDPNGDFDLPQNQARLYSRNVLSISENVIGLLVKQSPKELSFLHRAFLEYLSSYHLSRLELNQQKEFIEKFCIEPQTHEVILGLLQISNRSQDVRELVRCLQDKLNCVLPVDKFTVKLLLSEIAFGEFNCPPNLAKEIATGTFEEIELGFWMPHRERLLKNVLGGLRSTPLKETVKTKLEAWFPCRQRWRANVFEAISHWPPTAKTIDSLWKGLHDEDFGNKRAAAKSLAVIAQGDTQLVDRLIKLVTDAVTDLYTCAVALEALLNGWLSHEAIDNLLAAARYSTSPELRVVAIIGKIAKQVHTPEDYTELLKLGTWNSALDYHWKQDVISALINGWIQLPEIKTVCLDSLQERLGNPSKLDPSIALPVLIAGYPQDDDVAEFCINQLQQEKYPFVAAGVDDYNIWRLLAHNFRDHPNLVKAIDEWLLRPEQNFNESKVSFAALVGRTPRAKSRLLSLLNSSFPHWIAQALIEGWGLEDSKVIDGLTRKLLGSTSSASKISHLAPYILKNPEECRHRLLEILHSPKCFRHDLVLSGLRLLEDTQGDVEVIDYTLALLPNLKGSIRDLIVVELLKKYPLDPRIRNLAKQELSYRGDNVTFSLNATIAIAYKDDEEIKHQILQSLCPLPNQLRKIISTSLSNNSCDDELSLSILKLYAQEYEAEIKTQASIGYHTLLKKLGRNLDTDIERLSQNIICGGIDFEAQRQAAFSGLIVLNRFDIIVNSKEHNISSCQILSNYFLYSNPPLLKLILENWQDLKDAFGDELFPRLIGEKHNPVTLWTKLSSFADEYPAPCSELIEFLSNQSDRLTDPNILRFLGRTRPKSNLLLEYCLTALAGQSNQYDPSGERILVAAELLGENFGGDLTILERIASNTKKDFPPPSWVIIALAEGWHDSEDFGRIFDQVFQEGVERFLQEEMTLLSLRHQALIYRKGTSDLVFNVLRRLFQYADSRNQIRDRSLIIQRLQTDEKLLEMLINHLQESPTDTEKATIPKLIGKARGVSLWLRNWCSDELNAQLISDFSCVGIDLITGGLRPLTHSLLDVILSD